MATSTNKGIRVRVAEAIAGQAFEDVHETVERIKQLEESVAALAAPKKVSMREAAGVTIDKDEDSWTRLTGDAKRDLSSITRERAQALTIYMWETNNLGNRMVELPIAFILAEGVKVVAADDTGEVQKWIDEFWNDPINDMDMKLPKKCRELSMFGEQCYPTFVNDLSGKVRLGYLDPALIAEVVTDPDNAEQTIGVVTKRDKKGVQRKFKVIVNGDDADLFTQRTQTIREEFKDGECFYFKVNDLSNGARGRSDFLAQIDWLDAYDQFLFGQLERSEAMRAFIWDVTLTGASEAEVTERAKKIFAPRSRSVRVHNENEVWKAESPELGAYDAAASAKLFREHIMGGRTIPAHWFGGADDVNRSTGESMGEPTFKDFTMRQTYIGYMLLTICRYVVRMRERAHTSREIDLNDPVYAMSVEFPDMVVRDITKYAAALQQVAAALVLAIDRGVMTEQTAIRILQNISSRLGVEFDPDEELEEARKERGKRMEADVFHTPPVPPVTAEGIPNGEPADDV